MVKAHITLDRWMSLLLRLLPLRSCYPQTKDKYSLCLVHCPKRCRTRDLGPKVTPLLLNKAIRRAVGDITTS